MLPARTLHRSILVATALAVLTVGGCGDEADRPSRAAFEDEMVERYGADVDQAQCITDYTFDFYDDDEIELLRREGIGGIPQARWERHLSATVACLTSEDLP